MRKLASYMLLGALTGVLCLTANAQTTTPQPSAPASGLAPKLWIEAMIHDFGNVDAGTPLRYSFKVRNDGTADLRIMSVAPSCGCTTTYYDKTLAPGAEGKITLAIEHTVGYSGRVQKSATVTTNDPLQPRFSVSLQMMFKPSPNQPAAGTASMPPSAITKLGPFVLTPSNEWRSAVVRGESTGGIIDILIQNDKPAHITSVAPGGADFNVTLKTVEDGKKYSVVIANNRELKAGHYTQKVRLMTDDKSVGEIPLNLELTVYPYVVAAPASIHLSTVDLQATSQINVPPIYVQKVRGDDLLVTSVTSDLPFLKLEPRNDIKGRRYIIAITVDRAKLPAPGVFRGKIHIVTNDQEVPTLDVSIDGTLY
ncbi:MAG TPA: DUF1573 domain-containing protein [Blastocatellia bacterium]